MYLYNIIKLHNTLCDDGDDVEVGHDAVVYDAAVHDVVAHDEEAHDMAVL